MTDNLLSNKEVKRNVIDLDKYDQYQKESDRLDPHKRSIKRKQELEKSYQEAKGAFQVIGKWLVKVMPFLVPEQQPIPQGKEKNKTWGAKIYDLFNIGFYLITSNLTFAGIVLYFAIGMIATGGVNVALGVAAIIAKVIRTGLEIRQKIQIRKLNKEYSAIVEYFKARSLNNILFAMEPKLSGMNNISANNIVLHSSKSENSKHTTDKPLNYYLDYLQAVTGIFSNIIITPEEALWFAIKQSLIVIGSQSVDQVLKESCIQQDTKKILQECIDKAQSQKLFDYKNVNELRSSVHRLKLENFAMKKTILALHKDTVDCKMEYTKNLPLAEKEIGKFQPIKQSIFKDVSEGVLDQFNPWHIEQVEQAIGSENFYNENNKLSSKNTENIIANYDLAKANKLHRNIKNLTKEIGANARSDASSPKTRSINKQQVHRNTIARS